MPHPLSKEVCVGLAPVVASKLREFVAKGYSVRAASQALLRMLVPVNSTDVPVATGVGAAVAVPSPREGVRRVVSPLVPAATTLSVVGDLGTVIAKVVPPTLPPRPVPLPPAPSLPVPAMMGSGRVGVPGPGGGPGGRGMSGFTFNPPAWSSSSSMAGPGGLRSRPQGLKRFQVPYSDSDSGESEEEEGAWPYDGGGGW